MRKTVNEMTDNEIIPINIEKYAEALNNLIGADSAYFGGDKDVDAVVEIITLAKRMENIINRQKAEIERLQGYNENLLTANTALSNEILEIQSEAIKEYAEKLRKRLDRKYTIYGREYVLRHMREVVKEMTEEQK